MTNEIVRSRKEYYLQQKQNREENKINGIPWYLVFPKLGSIIPSIPKGYQVLWTGNSGAGKTTTWMGILLYSLYKIKKGYPGINFKFKLIIALLEDTKEMFIDRLYCMILNAKYGIKIDNFTLQSLNKDGLPQNVIDKLDDVTLEIEDFLQDCEIVDSIYNPTGLYKWTRGLTNKWGTHHNKSMTFSNEDGTSEDKQVYSHYVSNDSDMHYIMIVDNLNNLAQENTKEGHRLSQLETINLWSRTYCRLQITKHWKWTVINVIQQASDSEKQQFDYKGNSIIEKIKPSLDGIGNSKECQRDHFLVMGIFAPNRYGIRTYPEQGGYDISQMGDNYRSLIILKSNLSATNKEIPFYFNGAYCFLKELPKPEELTPTHYEKIKNNTVTY